ncbi:MAG: hypothetical protein FVQ81_13590 [Candidatus Glassbacteria bacterium]|nr:hypothetical protein [Candidatus Glassbacteria bacterium]
MSQDYSSQKTYFDWVKEDAKARKEELEKTLKAVFSAYLEFQQVEVICFSAMSAHKLAKALYQKPIILKALLAACNIGERALIRDLNISISTYGKKISQSNAQIIAGYIKPFLPDYLELNTLGKIDQIYFIDKEIRKKKGTWEKIITTTLNKVCRKEFKKRKFEIEGEQFEIDAASPAKGAIQVAIDVKRIEARRDIHKRCDEIANKASKLKNAFPDSLFFAVILFPFPEQHINIKSRLQSNNINNVIFAGDSKSSINDACKMIDALIKDKNKC